MARTTPVVQAETVTWSRDRHEHQFTVGTPAWYAWLEEVSTFAFVSDRGTFTARKEPRQHGGAYWKAYRKREGKLHRAYLGKSRDVTLQRLNAVAAQLSGQGDAPDRWASGNEMLQANQASITPLPTNVIVTQRLASPASVPKHNLPLQLTSFVGREQDVAAAVKHLRRPEVRLLTLTGPAGVGKTRLALAVAMELREHFVDGTCFVPLAPIGDPELVGSTIAQTLGISEVGALPIFERIKASLRQKHFLLVLDNFEQVVRAAPQVMELLLVCPQLKVLVTSRQVLRLQAEYLFPVPPLALPDLDCLPEREELAQYAAVSLFLQRAQELLPGFQLTEANVRAIAEICVHLDGLPLAIELAAARVRLLPPQALLARLSQRLAVLTGGAQDVPARQQTLRDTIAWSYDLLTAQEQRLFRCLSVFVGGFTLEEAEAVSKLSHETEPGAVSTLEVVEALLDKSLLLQGEQEGKEPRLLMLETIREFGLVCLRESGELEAASRAHAAYYLGLAEEAEPNLLGTEQGRWLDRLEQEQENLRTALGWLMERAQTEVDQAELALRMFGALESFWTACGHWSEGRMFMERALTISKGAGTLARAKALKAAAYWLFYTENEMDRQEPLLQESLAVYRELENTRGIVDILGQLGAIAREKGNFGAARSLEEEALALSQASDYKVAIARSLQHLGVLLKDQGEYVKAHALIEESLNLFRELGNTYGTANTLFRLAQVLFLSLGDLTTIHALLEESITLFRELNVKDGIDYSYWLLGEVALLEGDLALARSLLEESLAITRQLGAPISTADLLSDLAKVAARENDYAAARALYEESLAIARETGSKWRIAPYLEGLASVLATQKEFARGAQLWGAAEAIRAAFGTPLPPVERAVYERVVAATRSHLGEKAFAAAWSKGRTMSREQILAARGTAEVLALIPAEPSSAPPAPIPPTPPAGLTTRETEVLRLLAQGLTSAEIAEQLVIGVVTVNFHVRSIYSKLGVTSRSAATRYAIEHRLV
jgi:predicted ATPase/DNA-binding CsgD family transcriptional regulator